MPVRGDGELEGLCAQPGDDCTELRVHAVLARAEIDRAHGQSPDGLADLVERQAIEDDVFRCGFD